MIVLKNFKIQEYFINLFVNQVYNIQKITWTCDDNLTTGLKCKKGEKIGAEKCLCNCSYPIPTDACSDKLCTDGQTCFDDTCYNECQDLPFYNGESCFCFKEVCENGTYCNLTSGCQKNIPDCPQDYSVFTDETFCLCKQNETVNDLMNATSHYCMNNETIELPPKCPPVPSLAPDTLCTCNNTNVCNPGLMCDDTDYTCVVRPDPCPELPQIAGPEGCYCSLSHELCNETLSSCGGPDNKCYQPSKCLAKDWGSFHMSTVNTVEVDSENYAIEKTIVELKCNAGHYMESTLDDETFVDFFTVECGYDESWTGFQTCSPALCESLDFDDAVISETVWGEHQGTKLSEGTIAKLQCLEDGHLFDGSLVTRYFLTCYQKKWMVQDG